MNKKSNPKTIVKKKAIPFINIFLCTLLFFINNIIENIINTDSDYSWYDLIDKESGQLKSPIAQTITKNAGGEIAKLFSDIIYKRNRIIHSFRITSSKNEQILATKDRITNQQFYIDEHYLINFIELNNKLSYLLHEYRGY